MNKRDAKKAADTFAGTIGELRAMIRAAPRYGQSVVNKALTKERALEVFARALDGRQDDERPAMFQPDPYRPGQQAATGDRLIVQNIMRECR